jgi:hypothetical protein
MFRMAGLRDIRHPAECNSLPVYVVGQRFEVRSQVGHAVGGMTLCDAEEVLRS